MLYTKRNTSGEIVMLSKEPTSECNETIAPDSPEVLAFLADQPGSASHFIASDLKNNVDLLGGDSDTI